MWHGRPDRVALGYVAGRDGGTIGQLEHPALPAHVVAERLQQPVTGRALRHRHADHRGAASTCGVLHPARERRTDAAAPVGRVHRRVAAVVTAVLGIGHQPVAVEDTDCRVRDVEARPGPVTDDVGLLDGHLADVLDLLGRHHLEDGAGVVMLERAAGESVGKVHEGQVNKTNGRRGRPFTGRPRRAGAR